jgi:2-polyprenyl-6-methoxyphenol hydroxylase-like FAD-dependent oxidoreductase
VSSDLSRNHSRYAIQTSDALNALFQRSDQLGERCRVLSGKTVNQLFRRQGATHSRSNTHGRSYGFGELPAQPFALCDGRRDRLLLIAQRTHFLKVRQPHRVDFLLNQDTKLFMKVTQLFEQTLQVSDPRFLAINTHRDSPSYARATSAAAARCPVINRWFFSSRR